MSNLAFNRSLAIGRHQNANTTLNIASNTLSVHFRADGPSTPIGPGATFGATSARIAGRLRIRTALRCTACGRTGHEIKVSGRSYGLAE